MRAGAKVNPLKDLSERITQRLPKASCEFGIVKGYGSSFLNVIIKEKIVAVIELRPEKGFGLTFPPNFGSPEIFGDNIHSLVERLANLFKE